MMRGRALNGSVNLLMLLYIYLISAKLVAADKCLVSRMKCSNVFHASQLLTRSDIPNFGRVKNALTSKPLTQTTKLLAGFRLFLKTQVVMMLILMSNDIETQPGPIAEAQAYGELPKVRGFKVGHLNSRSVRYKMDDLCILFEQNSFDIMGISETWLDKSVDDSQVSVRGYDVLRQDRKQDRRGGGTMFYIRNGVPYKRRSDIDTEIVESCWVEINRPKAKSILVGCVYRAPDVSLDASIEELNSCISNIPPSYEICLLGDFNVDFLTSNKTKIICTQRRKMKNFAITNDLEQLITIPTRITELTKSAIDLLFVNNGHRIVSCGSLVSSISDHQVIFCIMKSGVPKGPPKTLEYRSFKSYDKNAFVRDVNDIDWDSIIDANENIEDKVNKWTDVFGNIANAHAPVKTMRVKGTHVPWMNTKLREAMRDRDYYHRRATKTSRAGDWEKYRKLKSFVAREVKRNKSEYYRELIDTNKGKPDELWKCINEVTGRKNKTSPSCIMSDGVCYTEAQSIAQILNSYFCTVASKLAEHFASIVGGASIILPLNNSIPISEKFYFGNVTTEYVEHQLFSLRTNKATGLDRIGARLLKDASSAIAPCLAKIFNYSFSTAIFPNLWKIGRIVALHKQGNRTDMNNYRPITILPTISKLLERAVHQQLYHYLNEKKVLAKEQHGFRARRATDTALIHFSDKILASMDSGQVTGVAFLDLSKAFDTVNHELLLGKLSRLGLADNSVSWFRSYLSNRLVITVVEGKKSSEMNIPNGVPQGSILGPLLFVLYMNDLPQCLKSCKVMLYADDTVLYYSSSMVSDVETKLNEDLENITVWFNNHFLTLNAEKSKFVLIGSSRKLNSCDAIKVTVQDHQVNQSATAKYLGITIHENLTWTEHVKVMSAKINQRIGILKRLRHILSKEELVTVYTSVILPLFDYADLVWGDKSNKVLMDDLQILQNKAAKVILGLPRAHSATDALQKLNWVKLNFRRTQHRRIAIHKCLHGIMDTELILTQNCNRHSYSTRQSANLYLPKVKTEWGKQRFTYQAASDWNDLENDTKNIANFNIFKRKLFSNT